MLSQFFVRSSQTSNIDSFAFLENVFFSPKSFCGLKFTVSYQLRIDKLPYAYLGFMYR